MKETENTRAVTAVPEHVSNLDPRLVREAEGKMEGLESSPSPRPSPPGEGDKVDAVKGPGAPGAEPSVLTGHPGGGKTGMGTGTSDFGGTAGFSVCDTEIIADKTLRREIDGQIQICKGLPASRERSLAITKLQEAVMWLGMDLKRLNEPNPYPNSKDPSNTKIEPTADGLKL